MDSATDSYFPASSATLQASSAQGSVVQMHAGPSRATGAFRSARSSSSPRTAFVLSGGASLGALQVGMLWALYERGIRADMLIGTSAGALNAAFLATRPPSVHTVRELATVWANLRREDLFPLHVRNLVAGVANHSDHLVPDTGMRALVRSHLQVERLEHTAIPLHLICFDLLSGREVRLSVGPALEAILGASAIPGVLPPVAWGQSLLADGGIVNNTPISHALELGAERIYVLPTESVGERGLRAAPRGAIDAALHALALLMGARLQADIARYSCEAELIVFQAPQARHVQPTDFAHAHELIRVARAAARLTLANASDPPRPLTERTVTA